MENRNAKPAETFNYKVVESGMGILSPALYFGEYRLPENRNYYRAKQYKCQYAQVFLYGVIELYEF